MNRRATMLALLALVVVAGLPSGDSRAVSGECIRYGNSRVSQSGNDTFCGGTGAGCEECTYNTVGGVGTCWQNYPFGGCQGSGTTGPWVY